MNKPMGAKLAEIRGGFGENPRFHRVSFVRMLENSRFHRPLSQGGMLKIIL